MKFILSIILALSTLATTAWAGPIADQCKAFANGEVEVEDGADYYWQFNETVLVPLSEGTLSMQAYAEALEINIGPLGIGLDQDRHCDMIRLFEDEGYEQKVTEYQCTGLTAGSNPKLMTLNFCSIGGYDGPQDRLLTNCQDSFVSVEVLFPNGNQAPFTVNFGTQDYVGFGLDESGLFLEMENNAVLNL
jgi:hypothetical protein